MSAPVVHPPLEGLDRLFMTIALAGASFMVVLDTSIANVSIPGISGELGVSPSQGTWIITSFAVSNAIAVPLTGWLARRVGEVRLFVLSMLLFSLASLGCGLSPSMPVLIAFRVMQGAVAGPMMPLSQTLLLSIYPQDRRAMALAIWSLTTLVAPVAGPILGIAGPILRHVGRRVAAGVEREAAIAPREEPHLRFVAADVAGEFVHEDNWIAGAGLFVIEPDAVVGVNMGHWKFPFRE